MWDSREVSEIFVLRLGGSRSYRKGGGGCKKKNGWRMLACLTPSQRYFLKADTILPPPRPSPTSLFLTTWNHHLLAHHKKFLSREGGSTQDLHPSNLTPSYLFIPLQSANRRFPQFRVPRNPHPLPTLPTNASAKNHGIYRRPRHPKRTLFSFSCLRPSFPLPLSSIS